MQDDTLRKRAAVQAVFAQGNRFSDRRLVVYVLPTGLDTRRSTVAAGRKLGGAVQRNRARRRLREAFRRERKEYLLGCDIVLLARAEVLTASYGEICASLRAQLMRGQAWLDAGAPSRDPR